jgi:hypothetical protein
MLSTIILDVCVYVKSVIFGVHLDWEVTLDDYLDLYIFMCKQVIALKVIEGVLTGRSARWILQQFMGPFLSLLVVSAGQMYFIICWLVLYFSARFKQDQNRFNSRVLEDFLDRLR